MSKLTRNNLIKSLILSVSVVMLGLFVAVFAVGCTIF
jgi:hypothetical protein